MQTSTREQHVALLADSLRRRFGDTCGELDIEAAVRAEYDSVCEAATVTTFAPILAERRVRRRLAGAASVETQELVTSEAG